MNAKTITQLLLEVVLACSAPVYAVAIQDGQSPAQFKIGDSRCVLVDDQIICTPVVTK